LPVDENRKALRNPLEAFSAHFAALEERINGRLLERMQRERDPRRRALIYAFPQQLIALKGILERFLADAFRTTRYEEPAFIRGLYFTSGTQEGSPIDRVMGSLAAAFGLNRQALLQHSGSGRSYFLT